VFIIPILVRIWDHREKPAVGEPDQIGDSSKESEQEHEVASLPVYLNASGSLSYEEA